MANLNVNIEPINEIIVVYDKPTKEVLACIPLNNGDSSILKNGIEFRLYKRGAEPTFKNANGVLMLNEDATVYKNLV